RSSKSPTNRSALATAPRWGSRKKPTPRCWSCRRRPRRSRSRVTDSCTVTSPRPRCVISCPAPSRTSKAANELRHQPADPPDCFTPGSGLFFAVMNFAALPERLAHVRAEIARRQATAGRTGPVTIVAVTKGFGLDAGEAQKSGSAPGEASVVAHRIAAQPHLALEGLMTIAPFTDDQDVQRRTFRALRVLRDALQEEGLWLPTLSMGMSADYGVAVEEGATVIRLGTVLFGPRERAAT